MRARQVIKTNNKQELSNQNRLGYGRERNRGRRAKGEAKEAGLVLRNSVKTLLQTATRRGGESEMLYRDLEIARDVQRASFPQHPPVIPGLNVASFYKPALCVGGDYYDFLPFRDGAWGIAIGDVCGKGIAAALVM